MRLLLDTHALIWFALGDRTLPDSVVTLIQAESSEVLVSAVSFYEIAFKRRRGRQPPGLPPDFATACGREGFTLIPITTEEAELAGALPELHRDPWDRILVAQASRRDAQLVTKDVELSAYGVPVIW